MTRRRGAVLGFGNVAEHGHVPVWLRRSDVELAAVADPDPDRRAAARRALPEARVYADPRELLRSEKLDFVDIAAPPAHHMALVKAAARGGCHVLCEKPLAVGVREYAEAAKVVRETGVVLYPVHNWKHSQQYYRAAALLGQGALGRLRRLRFEVVRDGQSVTVGSPWRRQAAVAGGGILVDHGWHVFYLLTSLARETPRAVRARVEQRRYTDADVEDTAECTVEFPSLTGEIRLTWAGTERRTRWLFEGERGALELAEDRWSLRRGNEISESVLPRSLSGGSHHPEWFEAVVDGFWREIDSGTMHGQELAEAELCLLLTTLAYASAAREGRSIPVSFGAASSGDSPERPPSGGPLGPDLLRVAGGLA